MRSPGSSATTSTAAPRCSRRRRGRAYTDTAAASGSNSYTIKAVDYAGNVSSASTAFAVVFDTMPPPAPTNLQAPSPARLPSLSWTAPTDVSGIDHYVITRDGSAVGASTTTSYTDTPAPSEGTHTYTVLAVDKAGNTGLPTAPKTVTVDSTPPPVPTGLTGPSPSTAKPVLSWTSGGPDVGSGFKSYEVFRNGVLMGSPTGASFSDTTLTTNGSYTYTVRALDNAGNESASSSAVAIVWDSTPPPSPSGLNGPVVVTGAPHLAWFSGGPDGLSGFDHYDVYRARRWSRSTTSTARRHGRRTPTAATATPSACGRRRAATRRCRPARASSCCATRRAPARRQRPQARRRRHAADAHAGTTATRRDELRRTAPRAARARPHDRQGPATAQTVDDEVLANSVYVLHGSSTIDAGGEPLDAVSARWRSGFDTVAPPAPTSLARGDADERADRRLSPVLRRRDPRLGHHRATTSTGTASASRRASRPPLAGTAAVAARRRLRRTR